MQNLILFDKVVYWSMRASMRNRLVPSAALSTLYLWRNFTKTCLLGGKYHTFTNLNCHYLCTTSYYLTKQYTGRASVRNRLVPSAALSTLQLCRKITKICIFYQFEILNCHYFFQPVLLLGLWRQISLSRLPSGWEGQGAAWIRQRH